MARIRTNCHEVYWNYYCQNFHVNQKNRISCLNVTDGIRLPGGKITTRHPLQRQKSCKKTSSDKGDYQRKEKGFQHGATT
jgi:hypothetical protein